MMKRLLLIFVLFLVSLTMLNAQWVSPGNGTTYTLPDLVSVSNGAVTNMGTVFSFNSDITISANDVLKIDNQVTRIDAVGVLITINGSMVCTNAARVGIYGSMTQNQQFSMRFENATDCELKTLYFSDGCGIKVIESNVDFIDCKFVYFTCDYANAVIDFMNCNPLIEDCYFLRNEGAAISSPANGQGSPRILNNVLEENVTSNINSPQINLGPGAEDTIYIIGNEIDDDYATHRVGGISIADLMGTGSTKVLLKDNKVINGRYGYNQQGLTISSVIERNQFIDNHFEDNPMNGGSGISIYGMDGNNKAVLRGNIITGNLWGITAINAFDIDLGTENDWGYNQIHDNGNSGVIYDLYNNSACDIMAVGNNWGTSHANEIEEHIVHQYDNPSYGLVTYIPFVDFDEVNENKTIDFAVWPNPVSNGVFNLVLDEATPSEVRIYNLNGQIIKSQQIDNKENNINVGILESGIYFVEVRNEYGNTVKRIVVK
jgi:hypothetical protein